MIRETTDVRSSLGEFPSRGWIQEGCLGEVLRDSAVPSTNSGCIGCLFDSGSLHSWDRVPPSLFDLLCDSYRLRPHQNDLREDTGTTFDCKKRVRLYSFDHTPTAPVVGEKISVSASSTTVRLRRRYLRKWVGVGRFSRVLDKKDR